MKDNNLFISWYKKRSLEYSEELPGDVWNNISDELDVNEVWQNVNSKLRFIEKRNILKQRIVFSLSIVLIFLIFLFKPASLINDYRSKFANIEYKPQVSNTKFQIPSSKYQVPNTKFQNLKPKTNDQIPFNKDSSLIVQIRWLSDDKEVSNPLAIGSQIQSSSSVNMYYDTSNNTISNIDFASVGVISNAMIKNSLLEITPIKAKTNMYDIDSSFTSDNISSNSIVKKQKEFYIGVIYSVNNTWLINNITVNGFNNNSLNQTNINFTHNIGLSACYYSNNWNIEMSGYINSKQKQSYLIYNEENYITKQISLNYSLLNFSLKHRNYSYCNWLNIPYAHNLIAGLNLAFLREGKEHLGNQTEQIGALYYKNDFGLRLGYEYEFHLYNRFLISSALIGDFGLKNIFKGDAITPGYFYQTHTGTIRINLGLKYLLKQ